MTQLDDHLARVERYGFVRDQFPLRYNEHKLVVLNNDAYRMEDDRLLFDFTLYCQRCTLEGGVSGRFPADDDEQVEHVCNARVAAFSAFYDEACKP